MKRSAIQQYPNAKKKAHTNLDIWSHLTFEQAEFAEKKEIFLHLCKIIAEDSSRIPDIFLNEFYLKDFEDILFDLSKQNEASPLLLIKSFSCILIGGKLLSHLLCVYALDFEVLFPFISSLANDKVDEFIVEGFREHRDLAFLLREYLMNAHKCPKLIAKITMEVCGDGLDFLELTLSLDRVSDELLLLLVEAVKNNFSFPLSIGFLKLLRKLGIHVLKDKLELYLLHCMYNFSSLVETEKMKLLELLNSVNVLSCQLGCFIHLLLICKKRLELFEFAEQRYFGTVELNCFIEFVNSHEITAQKELIESAVFESRSFDLIFRFLKNLKPMNPIKIKEIILCKNYSFDQLLGIIESLKDVDWIEIDEAIAFIKNSSVSNSTIAIIFYFLQKYDKEKEEIFALRAQGRKQHRFLVLLESIDVSACVSLIRNTKSQLKTRILMALFKYFPDFFDYEIFLSTRSPFFFDDTNASSIENSILSNRFRYITNPLCILNKSDFSMKDQLKLLRIYLNAFEVFFMNKVENKLFFHVQYCAAIHGILSLPFNSISAAFVNELFLYNPEIIKYVHLQTYPMDLIPKFVQNIPSMHVCLDFIEELIDSTRSFSRIFFGLQLLSHLCSKYPLPNR